GNGHSGAGNRQRRGQLSRGGQTISGLKAPVQDCLPDLTVDLGAEIGSIDKTDVKSHRPKLPFCALDWQLWVEINVPSRRSDLNGQKVSSGGRQIPSRPGPVSCASRPASILRAVSAKAAASRPGPPSATRRIRNCLRDRRKPQRSSTRTCARKSR